MNALVEWRAAIGDENVLTARERLVSYTANVNALTREISAVLRPADTRQVQQIVQVANRYRAALYPISCGRNWGYGSRLPVRDGAAILDLSRLDRIRNEFTLAGHYALIEPGVTQGKLYAALQRSGLPLLFNATAAGTETSVLGNSLDRGFGYFAMRAEDVGGMEVVLGTGEILQTGYGHYPNARATAHYKYGLGPSLDGLFFQSNFGVVTCATLHLYPRRDCHVTLIAKLQRDEDFAEFIDRLADLRRKSIVESVLHIGSRNRIRVTLAPAVYNFLVAQGAPPGDGLRRIAEEMLSREKYAAWTAVGGVFGTRGEVKAKLAQIKERLEGIAVVGVMTPQKLRRTEALLRLLGSAGRRKLAVFQGAKALMDFCLGIPSNMALLSPQWAVGESPDTASLELDDSNVGLLFCCPSLPLEGGAACEVVDCVQRVFQRFGFEPYMTLNIVNTKTLLCVLNLVFQRSDAHRARDAHRCVDSLFEEWARRGIYPYRLGIQSMDQFVRAEDIFWQIVRKLKHVLDPNEIIAPGRYNMV